MAQTRVLDMSRVRFIPGRIHATNNLYQRYGPKGFMEIKILQNDNLYVRVDLPGVPDDGVRHRVDSVRQKVVFFSGEETLSDDGDDKKNVCEYAGAAGLGCDCCEITGVDAKMKDGVLRMIVSRVKVKDHDKKCAHFLPPNTGKSGRYNMDDPAFNMAKAVEDHPFVVKGPKRSDDSVERRGDGSVLSCDNYVCLAFLFVMEWLAWCLRITSTLKTKWDWNSNL
ncbi:Heat shock protein HSP20/alpha crystallin family [Raphanus sativus]|uniref:Uncharacterized protein LOC108808073 n=1 Tax=Raphanus sativus TaxID=3726 RepID=A0A6J0JJG4_RAPSA|nr:uncharacterized protein LOC108808073 [Raphanus sativus]KAJ4888616.1 Heat shock protein HSP20/alpha crystallin family [Raphanus sativus]